MTRNWPRWIGYVTAAGSAVYAAFGVYWSLGGAGFPFGVGDAELAREGPLAFHVNLLGLATPDVAGPSIAIVGLLCCVAALAMARGRGGVLLRRVLVGLGGVVAVGLTVLVQDYRPIVVVAYSPILPVVKLFGGLPDTGFGDLYTWPRLNLLVLSVLGLAWALTTVAYRRRCLDACEYCGRMEGRSSEALVRWGRRAVVVAVVVPLVYCATRWAWALGLSVGIDPEFYREGQRSGLWWAGAALATFGALGAVLTIGLVRPWGEVFPRWMIGLRGRRVPPMLAVIPAVTVAVLVTSAGWMYIRLVLGMGSTGGGWAMALPETLWPLWGAGLFVAAIGYHRRRRRACAECGRGEAGRRPTEPATGDGSVGLRVVSGTGMASIG